MQLDQILNEWTEVGFFSWALMKIRSVLDNDALFLVLDLLTYHCIQGYNMLISYNEVLDK